MHLKIPSLITEQIFHENVFNFHETLNWNNINNCTNCAMFLFAARATYLTNLQRLINLQLFHHYVCNKNIEMRITKNTICIYK